MKLKKKKEENKILIAKKESLDKWNRIAALIENVQKVVGEDCGYCEVYGNDNHRYTCGNCPLNKVGACYDDGTSKKGKRSDYWKFVKYIDEAQLHADEVRDSIYHDIEDKDSNK